MFDSVKGLLSSKFAQIAVEFDKRLFEIISGDPPPDRPPRHTIPLEDHKKECAKLRGIIYAERDAAKKGHRELAFEFDTTVRRLEADVRHLNSLLSEKRSDFVIGKIKEVDSILSTPGIESLIYSIGENEVPAPPLLIWIRNRLTGGFFPPGPPAKK